MAPLPLWQHNKEEEEEMERKRASEPSLHSSGLLPGTMSLRCPYFLFKNSKHLSNVHKHAHTQTHTHLEKLVKHPFHLVPSLWLHAHYFQLRRYRHRGNLNSLCSMSILVQQRCTSDRYSLLNERACCQKAWEVKREERGDQRHQALLSVSLRCRESQMEQQGDYRLADYTWSNSTVAIHHNSIFSPVLPLQPINTVKQSYLHW